MYWNTTVKERQNVANSFMKFFLVKNLCFQQFMFLSGVIRLLLIVQELTQYEMSVDDFFHNFLAVLVYNVFQT